MGNHDGHRQRLKEKFLATNGVGLEDHELLEVLLFYSVPRINTNEQAHELINSFGSLKGVFDADVKELCNVDKIGDSSATLIKVVSALMSRYSMQSQDPRQKYTTFSQISTYLQGLFIGHSNERVYMVLFNNSMRIIKTILVGEGVVNMAALDSSMVAKSTLGYNAAYVAIAHNHPAGLAIPSLEDVHVSYAMKDSFKTIGLTMIDHFLVADGKCVPILRTVEKGRRNDDALTKNYVLKSFDFEIEDDLNYELFENINK